MTYSSKILPKTMQTRLYILAWVDFTVLFLLAFLSMLQVLSNIGKPNKWWLGVCHITIFIMQARSMWKSDIDGILTFNKKIQDMDLA